MLKLAAFGTICCLLLSPLSQADEQRWFEVEVIIFSQTPAADIQEQFDQPVKPIRPGRSIDLVTPLFQANITKLLDTLPLCPVPEQPAINTAYFYQLNKLCIFEPQPKPIQMRSIMQARYYDSQLPMPDHINALITGTSKHRNQPYLVANSALQLSGITTRLQRQTDKKLLLHTAWRQAPVTQRRAIASHWYAGKNFSKDFNYWGQKTQSANGKPSNIPLDDLTEIDAVLDNNGVMPVAVNQTDIIANIEQLLTQLNANPQLPELLIIDHDSNIAVNEQQLGSKVPDHTWQLDGLFKLHLDHYLFVNTEFNLRVPSSGSLKTVHVKQSRRIISGEIHYLDHPYLGIILQIRRFDPELNISNTLPE